MILFNTLLLCTAMISLWIYKTPWVWTTFLVISCFSAWTASIITSSAVLWISALGGLLILLKAHLQGLLRWICIVLIWLITSALFYNLLPGFPPAKLWLDTPFVFGQLCSGLLLLGIVIPTIQTSLAWRTYMQTTLPITIFAAIIFISIALHSHGTFSLSLHILGKLFSQILPEEALLRGVLQREIATWAGGSWRGALAGVLFSTLFAPLFQLSWILDPALLGFACLTGFMTGIIYQGTKQIEGSILFRFLISSITLT